MDLKIAGRWALVCGSSQGLGWGCARALALEGVHVVLNGRHAERLAEAVRNLRQELDAAGLSSTQVLSVAADVTTPQGQEQLWSVPGGPGRDFDILVTNAGGPPPGDFRDWDQAQWSAALQANMLTPIELIRTVIDGMAARGFGRIINITSSAVKAPIDVLGLSNGARSGLTGFVAGLARSADIASRGVTINNLLPGKFATQRLEVTLEGMGRRSGLSVEEVRQRQLAAVPAGRFGTPEEFGAMCAFLCSAQAGYFNGQNVLVDGGAYPGAY